MLGQSFLSRVAARRNAGRPSVAIPRQRGKVGAPGRPNVDISATGPTRNEMPRQRTMPMPVPPGFGMERLGQVGIPRNEMPRQRTGFGMEHIGRPIQTMPAPIAGGVPRPADGLADGVDAFAGAKTSAQPQGDAGRCPTCGRPL